MKPLLLSLILLSTAHAQTPAQQLLVALNRSDAAAIANVVSQERTRLGSAAGVPEVADTYYPVPANTPWIDTALARRGFTPHFERLRRMTAAWKPGIDPTSMTEALRAPAAVIIGCVAIAKADLEGKAEALQLASTLADFLMWTQAQAGAGCFPFPAAKGTSKDRAMQVATRFLNKAKKAGKLAETVRNGWAFEDHGDGGLQFDNAECGLALFELHELTQDARQLASARKAADWALARPLCPNWNYNAFSVHLLAKAHAVTQDLHYLEAALQKARLGVIPGQLTEGPHAGRWLDAHNARPAYHYIMMGALAQLAAGLPIEHPGHPITVSALKLGLTARNTEFATRGVMNKDKAMEALLLIFDLFVDDPTFLETTQTRTALQVLGALVSEENRRGKLPLGPRAWGLFLAHAATRSPRG
jgi:hypothetical protein